MQKTRTLGRKASYGLRMVLKRDDEIPLQPERGIDLHIFGPNKSYQYPVQILVAFSILVTSIQKKKKDHLGI